MLVTASPGGMDKLRGPSGTSLVFGSLVVGRRVVHLYNPTYQSSSRLTLVCLSELYLIFEKSLQSKFVRKDNLSIKPKRHVQTFL
jgi:hypothetical protein